MSLPELFYAARGVEFEVDEATGCWNWLKGKNPAGYPFSYAHRRYWETANGPRPAGYDIHHLCKNPACVNPAHLAAIDRRYHAVHHHLNEKVGLELADVREVRRLGRESELTALEVAERFGISFKSVYNYWNGKRWADLLGDGEVVRGGERTCPHCQQAFNGNNRHATYCSKRCQQYAWAKRSRGPRLHEACTVCGGSMEHRRHNARFCSDQCMKVEERERRRKAA